MKERLSYAGNIPKIFGTKIYALALGEMVICTASDQNALTINLYCQNVLAQPKTQSSQKQMARKGKFGGIVQKGKKGKQ